MRSAIVVILMLISAAPASAAIDSREKRQSIAVLGNPWAGALPTPNGTPDQEWRQELGFLYSGILAGSPSAPTAQLLMRLLQEDLQ